MSYLDIFVAAVPTARKDDYLAFTARTHELILSFGATEVLDYWGDDIPEGETTSFPMAVACDADETVASGWIVWPSKEVRDAGMARMMSDPEMAKLDMPFDGRRMIFGGFVPLLESR
jgi:uncharacterized protein YbaA (DUF1428 family)